MLKSNRGKQATGSLVDMSGHLGKVPVIGQFATIQAPFYNHSVLAFADFAAMKEV